MEHLWVHGGSIVPCIKNDNCCPSSPPLPPWILGLIRQRAGERDPIRGWAAIGSDKLGPLTHLAAHQCCQLFAQLFGQSRRKIRPQRKKIRSPVNFPFWRNLGKNTIFVCVSGKITIFLGNFPRIREDKMRETILLKIDPFSALFVQYRPIFGRRIVRPLHFLFGPFWLMRQNNRPVGNTAAHQRIQYLHYTR